MKNKALILLCAALLLSCFCGCTQGVDLTYEETHDFDPDTAAAMVDEAEWLITWLQTQDSISRDEADALIARLNRTLNGDDSDGENIVMAALSDAADYLGWEDGTLQTLSVGNPCISPTVYYEGVSITSATVERFGELSEETGNEVWSSSTLRIHKAYTGDAEELRDWSLEYIFKRYREDEPWRFVSWNGTYNVEVSLPLKAAFYKTDYSME